jgi:hypothetical protein
MKLTYEALLNDPTLIDRIEAQARRERAKAVHELVLVPITRLVTDPAARAGSGRRFSASKYA